MAQSANESIDFQLISVPHHCHKADKYLSRVTTFATRAWAQTPSEDKTIFCVLSANGARRDICAKSIMSPAVLYLAHMIELIS